MSNEKTINQPADGAEKFINPNYAKREVTGPDGQRFIVDPLQDYFSDQRPKVYEPNSIPVIEKFLN